MNIIKTKASVILLVLYATTASARGDDGKWHSTFRIDPTKSPKHLDIVFQKDGKQIVKKYIDRLGNDAIFFVERESNDSAPITRDDKRLMTYLRRVTESEVEEHE